MLFHATSSAIILFLTSAIIAMTALLAWTRRETPPGREAFRLFGAVVIWSLGAALSEAALTAEVSVFWTKVEYIGAVSAAPLALMFCLTYVHHPYARNSRLLVLIWVIPVITLLLAATNDWHHLFWTSIVSSPQADMGLFVFHHGPAYWLFVVYNYIYSLAAAVLIWAEHLRSGSLYRRQGSAILLSMVFPWIGGALYSFGVMPILGLDIVPISFAFSAIIIAAAIFSTRLLELIPVAHNVLLQSMQDAVIVLDSRNRVIETNPAMAHLLGHLELPLGQSAADVFHEWPALAALLAQQHPLPSELTLPDEPGRYFDVRIMPVRGAQRNDDGRIAVLRETTRRKQAELALEAKSREMEQQAITDDLTGLYNRRYVNRLLADEFSRALRYGVMFSVALLDIDYLKQINDTLGHQAGDEVLCRVARVLQTDLRANDVAARVGGDEFMVILPHTDLKGAFQVMDRVRINLGEQTITHGQSCSTCSVGLTSRTPDDSQETLLQRADRLLYAAKEQGRNRVIHGT